MTKLQLRSIASSSTYDFSALKTEMLQALAKGIDDWANRLQEAGEIDATAHKAIAKMRDDMIEACNNTDNLSNLLACFLEFTSGQEITTQFNNGMQLKVPSGEMCGILVSAVNAGLHYLHEHHINGEVAARLHQARQQLQWTLNANRFDDPSHPDDVAFARKGYCSEEEFLRAVDAAAAETFHSMKQAIDEQDACDDIKQQMHDQNLEIYRGLNLNLLSQGSGYFRLQNFIDQSANAYFKTLPRDEASQLSLSWPMRFLQVLETRLKHNQVNSEPEVQGNSVTSFAARIKNQSAATEISGDDDTIKSRIQMLEHLHRYAETSEEAVQLCDAIIVEELGGNHGETMLDVVARNKGIAADEHPSIEQIDKLFDAVDTALIEYIQNHFFNRVNAAYPGMETSALTCEYDDNGYEVPFPLHSYYLVRKAYAMAKEATHASGLPEGTDLYTQLLRKNENTMLKALADSDAWQCAIPEDFSTAELALQINFQQLKAGRSAGV